METVKLDFPDKDLYILKDGDWHGFRSIPCKKEPETVEWIRSFEEGSVFWDVGASVGPYSLIAAALGYQTIAFEPFAPSYGHLWQNIWHNGFDHLISAYHVALGHESVMMIMGVSSHEPGSASHGTPSDIATQIVPVDTADQIQKIDGVMPTHVKIDVDGAELGVIEGGRETWKRAKSIMVESQPPTIDDITVILSGAGLELVQSWPRWGETKQRNYLFRRA